MIAENGNRKVEKEQGVIKNSIKALLLIFWLLGTVLIPNYQLIADDETINGSCPGELIEEINGTIVDMSFSESGLIKDGEDLEDIYRVTFAVSGSLNIRSRTTGSKYTESYYLYVVKNNCGNWGTSVKYPPEDKYNYTIDVNAGDTIYIKLGATWWGSAYELSLNFTTKTPACATKSGLNGRYYDNVTNTNPWVFLREDSNVDFNWGLNSPDSRIDTDNFSVSWEGYILAPEDANYVFSLAHNDELQLIIDGNIIYDNTSPTSNPESFRDATPVNLTEGCHRIKVIMVEGTGDAYARVKWKNDSFLPYSHIIPNKYLFHDEMPTCNGCDCSLDDNTINSISPGALIPSLDGIKDDTSVCLSGVSNDNDNELYKQDYYHFRVDADGSLDIVTSSPNNHGYHMQVWVNGISMYGDEEGSIHPIQTLYLKKGDEVIIKFKEAGYDLDEYQVKFDFKMSNIGDLCYENITIEDMSCVSGVLDNPPSNESNCKKQRVDIINQREDNLTDVKIDLNSSTIQSVDCGIDSNSGDCNKNSNKNDSIINYDMPNYARGESHSIYLTTTETNDAISNNIYATYKKGEEVYKDKLKLCDKCVYVEWQKDRYSIYEDFKNPMPPKKVLNTVIELTKVVDYDVTVHYKTINGIATAGNDYIAEDAVVTIKAGERNVTIPIWIYNDNPIELDEDFYVQLYNQSPDDKICLNDHNKTQIIIKAQVDSPICFEDDFKTELDDKWRVLTSSKKFTPQIVNVNGDDRLRITPNSHGVATAITKDYKFNTRENLIIVEFDYYAYGGCGDGHDGLGKDGADGIVNVLFDSDVGESPKVGGYGGSMGYAQILSKPGFEGGWLGLGLDEFGNFGNCNEGRVGGLPGTSCDDGRGFGPWNHRNTAIIRGDVNNGDRLEGYEFLAGVELTIPPLNQPKVAQKSGYDENGYFSGRYKMTIDARDVEHLYIRLERSLTLDNNFSVIIKQFDAKDPKYGQGETPEFVRYAITGGTGGGCNNHEISWIRLKGNCQIYDSVEELISGPFVAIDTFRWNSNANTLLDKEDQAISTKDVNSTFQLLIASLNEDMFTGEKKMNIDVKYGIFSGKELQLKSLSTIRDFNATNDIFTIDDFQVDEAYRDAYVRIFYCAEKNSTEQKIYLFPLKQCGVIDNDPDFLIKNSYAEDGTEKDQKLIYYHDSNHFAIKPSGFEMNGIVSDSIYKAGENLNATFKAIDAKNNPSKGYNEVVGTTFLVDINDSKGCNVAKFNDPLKNGWGFSDGQKTLHTKYPEVGNISIKISDTNLSCTNRFAHIDCEDKNITGVWNTDKDTAIGEAEINNVIFLPDHFDINVTFKDFHVASGTNDVNYTYISKDLNMSSSLDLDIYAKDLDGNTTFNYNKECYAQTLNTLDIKYLINSNKAKISTNPNPNPGNLDKLIFELKDDTTYTYPVTSQNLGDKLVIANLPVDIFGTDHNGSAVLKMKINFDRRINQPVQPFLFTINDINITDANNTKNKNNFMTNKNATYLYGRLKSSQKLYDNIVESSVKTPISIVVYSLPATGTVTLDSALFASTNEYNWLLNTIHNPANDASISLVSTNPSKGGVSSVLLNSGSDEDVTVTALSSTRPLEVDINLTGTSEWLIYNPDSDSEPSPFYRVRFIGGVSNWAGYGKTGHVVDTNSSNRKTKRLEW